MSYSASRMTSYAVISAIESDLRNFIKRDFLSQKALNEIACAEVYQKIVQRSDKEKSFYEGFPNDQDLLLYLDFADSLEIIRRNLSLLSNETKNIYHKIYAAIIDLIPIRNRVMHTRPLMPGDFPTVMDKAQLIKERWNDLFPSLIECLERLRKNPEFVLSLELKDEYLDDRVANNLPIPDFDETGFIGRKEDVKKILDHISGAYPVITLIGIGGIGKTALALKVAYDLLDDNDCEFDAIVWTTSKSTLLGRSEILKIEDAISDSLGVVKSISEGLGASIKEDFSEILEYMGTFKILLVLDNLETVLDTKIRDFLSRIPKGSKVLITSRVGLGGYDLPYTLKPFEIKESIKLLMYPVRPSWTVEG